MQDDILVSCTVVSYNSAETVIETLESIKAQTYQNIELIVSDDCSTDNTVELCREWIAANKERFVRAVLLTVEKNTGVAGNDNRALAECRGVWQKGIAADDKLLPNCVEDFMNFVKDHPEAKWVSSRIRKYNGFFEEKYCIGQGLAASLSFFEKDAMGQLRYLAISNVVYAPSLFYNLSFKRLIGIDSSYMFEDLPFYVDALERGYKCYFMDKETVCYRVHQSLSNSGTNLFNYKNELVFRRYRKERLLKYLNKKQKKGLLMSWKTQDFFYYSRMNKKSPFNEWLYKNINKIIAKIYH